MSQISEAQDNAKLQAERTTQEAIKAAETQDEVDRAVL